MHDGKVFDRFFGPSEPPSVARSASDTTPTSYHAGHTDTPRCPVCVPPKPWVILKDHCPLCAVDRSLKAHVVAFTRAVDSLEAVVARLKRFLMVDGQGVEG